MKYKQWNVELELGEYSNNRVGISLIDSNDGEYVLTATINIPEVPLADDEVIIKNYSENEGILDWLIENEIISSPARFIPVGYTLAPICKINKAKLGGLL
jgi:hypothetical protein